MPENLTNKEQMISLAPAILGAIPQLSVGPLRVYIFLCSRNSGELFVATVPEIMAATGLKRRAVVSSLKTLRNRRLIVRCARKADNCNYYGILFANLEGPQEPQESQPQRTPPVVTARSAIPPKSEPKELTEGIHVAASTPDVRKPQEEKPAVTKGSDAPCKPQPVSVSEVIRRLVKARYRSVTEKEWATLMEEYPDSVVLRQKLEGFGGVDEGLPMGFFMQALRQFR